MSHLLRKLLLFFTKIYIALLPVSSSEILLDQKIYVQPNVITKSIRKFNEIELIFKYHDLPNENLYNLERNNLDSESAKIESNVDTTEKISNSHFSNYNVTLTNSLEKNFPTQHDEIIRLFQK